ncbi:MAG: prolipoprotein diacylglyceryl transferase [Candidatus Omnitrophica bacterium]|nr:prolipoprotein diacylglyceryl transferase [Candidatus Omnitrophota bacterium]
MGWMERLKTKWQIKSNWDFWMIMLSFSLAGMAIMPVRKLIFHLVGITDKTPLWVKILIYIPLIPPAYYIGLLVVGTLLGQFQFFWGFLSARLKFLTGKKK